MTFFAAVGIGDLTSEAIAKRLESYVISQSAEKKEKPSEEEDLYSATPSPPPEVVTDGINVRGTGGLLTHLGKCCNPLPGEEIVGYITRGHGVTIHRQDCPNILRMGPDDLERLIEVDWGHERRTFPIQIVITAHDRPGLLHDVTEVIMNNDINMASVSTGKRSRYNILPVYMTLDVPDLVTLTRVLAKIGQVRNVITAKRLVT